MTRKWWIGNYPDQRGIDGSSVITRASALDQFLPVSVRLAACGRRAADRALH
jgi:hypothetical protein